jgi:hypothetical protein
VPAALRLTLARHSAMRAVGLLLSAVFIGCVFGALAFSALLITVQAAREQRQRQHNERSARARRLRWVHDGKEVYLGDPVLADSCAEASVVSNAGSPTKAATTATASAVAERFHIFLSHVWGTVRWGGNSDAVALLPHGCFMALLSARSRLPCVRAGPGPDAHCQATAARDAARRARLPRYLLPPCPPNPASTASSEDACSMHCPDRRR